MLNKINENKIIFFLLGHGSHYCVREENSELYLLKNKLFPNFHIKKILGLNILCKSDEKANVSHRAAQAEGWAAVYFQTSSLDK